MPKVVPSDVVAVIVKAYAGVDQLPAHTSLAYTEGGVLEGIIDLVDQISPELITLVGDDYAAFTLTVGTIRNAIEYWKSQGAAITLSSVRGYNKHALRLLYETLGKCPDEAPKATATDLAYIKDADLRDSIRGDLSGAHADYATGEWKSSTVIAGAVIEALLFWALSTIGEEKARGAAKDLFKSSPPPLNEWHLRHYIIVAVRLGLIDEETAKQAELSNDFRNLIHPGREQRLERKCTKGTALGALAGAEKVAEALKAKF